MTLLVKNKENDSIVMVDADFTAAWLLLTKTKVPRGAPPPCARWYAAARRRRNHFNPGSISD